LSSEQLGISTRTREQELVVGGEHGIGRELGKWPASKTASIKLELP
jgi:hypothetical protein